MLKKISALFMAAILILSLGSCGPKAQKEERAELLESAQVSLEEGQFFFVGKVLSVVNDRKMITYYDAEPEKCTFYQVEITKDLFGCLPQKVLTLGVYGTSEIFANRKALEKGKEYYFNVRLWADEEKALYLLPTFYSGLPERRGEKLILAKPDETLDLGKWEDYQKELLALATKVGYGPEKVMESMESQLDLAVKNSNRAHFDEIGVTETDDAFLKKVTAVAKELLEKAKDAEKTWNGIKGVLE